MTKVAIKALALAGVCCVFAGGAARADVIYTLSVGPGYEGSNFTVAMIGLTDSQVASGSFALHGSGSGGYEYPSGIPLFNYTGDTAGFVTATLAGERVAPNYIYGSANINMTFGPGDALSSVSINYGGEGSGVTISGTGAASQVTFGSDDPYICPVDSDGYNQSSCSFSNVRWSVTDTDPSAPVPEPASFAVLGLGLLGFGAVRRRWS